MTNIIVDTSQRKAARVAGFMFLFILTDVILNWVLYSKFIDLQNVTSAANNIIANELFFRFGIANEMVLAACAVILALALYIVLKPVNRNLALLALLWKVAEGIITAVIALVNFSALQILHEKSSLAVFEPEQMQTLAGLIINMHDVLYAIPMLFLGLNLTLFSYLFYKSKYIPLLISGLGILSYTLVFIFAFVSILLPDFPGMILTVPSIFFELIIGLWLLIKGINANTDK
jgi:hypothetical protein